MGVFLHDCFKSVMKDTSCNLKSIGIILDIIGCYNMPKGMSSKTGTTRYIAFRNIKNTL